MAITANWAEAARNTTEESATQKKEPVNIQTVTIEETVETLPCWAEAARVSEEFLLI